MTGLDKIIEQIKVDTDIACESILKEARATSQRILDEAKTAGENEARKIELSAQEKVRDISLRAESAAALEKKKATLYAKQTAISTMLFEAKKYILSLPDDEYFDLILKMVRKNAMDINGEIIFSQEDKKRLPHDFEQKLFDASNGKLTVSKAFIKHTGGFILSYGGIEENCTFDAVFASESERLSDEISHLLFT